MVDVGLCAGQLERVAPYRRAGIQRALDAGAAEPPAAGVVKCVPLSVRTVWILWGTSWIRYRKKSPTTRRVAFACNSAQENFDVISIASSL